jgi:RNA polymerase sigma-19 factor, ECF subfamily
VGSGPKGLRGVALCSSPGIFQRPSKYTAAVDDRELLDRIRRSDEDAFDSVFRAYYAALVGIAEELLRSRAEAEEVGQDVMLELWRRRESLRIDDSLRGYLFQATRNRALNHIRHRRVERRGEPHVAPASSVPAVADAELVHEEIDAAVRQTVAELPPRCREVFELSRVHGLSYGEIARTLGISVKTVEAQMGKALRTLRERLAPWLPGGGM